MQEYLKEAKLELNFAKDPECKQIIASGSTHPFFATEIDRNKGPYEALSQSLDSPLFIFYSRRPGHFHASIKVGIVREK